MNFRLLILLTPFILVYILPAFGIVFDESRRIFASAFIIPIIAISIYLLNAKSINRNLKLLYKNTPFKNFMYLYAWLIISGIIAVVRGYYTFGYFIIMVIISFFFRGFLLYLYPSIVFPKYINLKILIKFFLIAIYIVLLMGIIEFIVSILNFQPILDLIHLFSNAAHTEVVVLDAYSAIPRIRSLMVEPGALADFIAASIPFIINIPDSKYRIFKNKYLNLFVKKTIFPMSVVCLFLTQSPIGLLFGIGMIIYVYYKKITKLLKKYYYFTIPVIIIMVISIAISFTKMNIAESFIVRIFNVIGSILEGNFDEFILIEPSLATRVLNYLNQIQLWLKHPIAGVGAFNRGWVLYKQLQYSTLPYTPEIKRNIMEYNGLLTANMTPMTQLLYQTGIIGFVLYIIYMVKNIKYLNKVTVYFTNLEKVFVISFKQHFVYIFVKAFLYGPAFINPLAFFAMGISNGLILLALSKIKENTQEEKINVNNK